MVKYPIMYTWPFVSQIAYQDSTVYKLTNALYLTMCGMCMVFACLVGSCLDEKE